MKKFFLFDIFKRQQSINKMKLSKDLFYGIIIGILLFASTGSMKKGKEEFKEVQIIHLSQDIYKADSKIKNLLEFGWTIIDYEVEKINQFDTYHYALIGR